MNRAKLLSALTFVVAVSSELFSQPSSYPFLNQYHLAIERALTQKDPSVLLPYFAAGIRLMPPFQKTVKGSTHVAAYYRALSNRFVVSKVDFKSIKVYNVGDTALVDQGTFQHTLRLTAGGPSHTITGNYLHLWNIRDRTKPVLINDIWNVAALPFDNVQLRFPELPTVDVALSPHVPINNDISFELGALNRLMEATVAQHDVVAWTLFYADDASLLTSNGKYYAGKEAIKRYLTEHCPDLPIFEKLDIRNDEINDVGGGYIIEYASHIAVWRYDEHSGIGLGKDFRIWKRQVTGHLKLLVHIGSYD